MTEALILAAIVLTGLGLAGLGGLAYARARAYRRALRRSSAAGDPRPAVAPEAEFSLARYRPMFRLLSGEDADFLNHNWHCPKIARQWKRSQRRIIRLYLKELAADFKRLHRNARSLMVQAPEQYAHLGPMLLQQRVAFWRALIWIELRLSLGGAGLPRIKPEALAGAFESLRQEISRGTNLAHDRLA